MKNLRDPVPELGIGPAEHIVFHIPEVEDGCRMAVWQRVKLILADGRGR